eukprot:m.156129 g.156129  ORF g.156129 m.156129 type:complete len:374 (+) comp24677_c1_seq3:54-1175(+)
MVLFCFVFILLFLMMLLLFLVVLFVGSGAGIPHLKDLAKGKLFMGAAVSCPILENPSDPAFKNYSNVLWSQYSLITPGNALKMRQTEPRRGQFNFTEGDIVVNKALSLNVTVRGHNLCWVAHNPSWVAAGNFSSEELKDILTTHITTEVQHFRGRLYSWDVVNEAIQDNAPSSCTNWKCALKTHGSDPSSVNWTKVPDYVAYAFNLTHANDPDVRLFYNDYNLHDNNTKVEFVYQMLRDLRAGGVPIHGLGMQMHISQNEWNVTQFAVNLERFASLGLEIHVTEMDKKPASYPPNTTTTEQLKLQAEIYGQALGVCLANPACTSFETWGFTDYTTDEGRLSGVGMYPFDQYFQPKPLFYGLVDKFGPGGADIG